MRTELDGHMRRQTYLFCFLPIDYVGLVRRTRVHRGVYIAGRCAPPVGSAGAARAPRTAPWSCPANPDPVERGFFVSNPHKAVLGSHVACLGHPVLCHAKEQLPEAAALGPVEEVRPRLNNC